MSIISIPKRGSMNKNDFVSDKRLYLDKDGNVVEEKDPNRLTLLVAAGGRLPMEQAQKYGLVKADEADAVLTSDGETAEAGEDLESMTKAELLEFAEAHGVEVKPNWNKAQIVEVLSQDPTQPR
jgi:hypothetical protein